MSRGGFVRFQQSQRAGVRSVAIVLLVAVVGLLEAGCGVSDPKQLSKQQQPVSVTDHVTGRPVLLFNGVGTSSTDVAAVEAILNSMGLGFATANTAQLNAMTQAQMNAYRLFIVPGGNSITIGDNLTKTATSRVHNAVINGGLHYLGICAGGFFGGYSIYNGLNLTNGKWFNLYSSAYKESLNISFPNGSKLDVYWQQGPQFTGWGSIVARFPDGAPAIVEGKSGIGWTILAGVHPEAPLSWRYGMSFTSSVASNNSYAKTLISAALNGTVLPHF
jgi:glutamine amidotransferase-like uncharacterized protein